MSIITEPGATPSAPNTKTTIAESTAGTPTVKTTVSGANAAIPNTKTTLAESTAGIPNSKTTIAEDSAVIPTVKTTVAAVNAAIPNSKTTIGVAGIPRSIAPLVNMDFAANLFAQCNIPVLFDDLFTYSRASSASFINRRIVCGKAEFFLDTDFVGDVENLALFSEQFDNAAWTKDSIAVLADNDEDENGDRIADRIHPSSTGTNRGVNQDITATTADHDVSFKIKAAGFNWVKIFDAAGTNGAWFNIKLGVIGTISGTPAAKIEPLDNDYFRCSITDAGAVSGTAKMILADSDNTTTATLNGIDGVLIVGAQLTLGSKTIPYVKTISSPVTETFTETLRIEYDPVTGENLGALIEGNSTNLALRSEEFDNATWTKTRSSITANDTMAIDGTTSSDKLVEDATAASTHESQQIITATDNLDYTFSILAKRAERNWIAIGIVDKAGALKGSYYDLANGTVGGDLVGAPISSKIELTDDNWFRLSITVNASTGGASINARIHLADDDQGRVYDGDGSSGLFLGGSQVEQLPLASSYIRTEGSSVSRVADDLESPSLGNFKEDEYSLFSLFSYTSDSNTVGDVYSITDGTSNNRVIFRTTSGGSSWLSVSGGTVDISGSGPALAEGEEIKQTSTLKGGIFTGYINGVSSFTDPSSSPLADHNVINIGSFNTTSDYLFGHVKKISIYDKGLTAQEVSLL